MSELVRVVVDAMGGDYARRNRSRARWKPCGKIKAYLYIWREKRM